MKSEDNPTEEHSYASEMAAASRAYNPYSIDVLSFKSYSGFSIVGLYCRLRYYASGRYGQAFFPYDTQLSDSPRSTT